LPSVSLKLFIHDFGFPQKQLQPISFTEMNTCLKSVTFISNNIMHTRAVMEWTFKDTNQVWYGYFLFQFCDVAQVAIVNKNI
jgi:hypothetical protein